MSSRAVFLDRDGVINRNVFYDDTGEWESPRTVADFALINGVLPALHSLQQAGFLLFVVSNQPSFAKGKTTMGDLRAIHIRMENLLRASGIRFAGVFYCYHHPQGVVPSLAVHCACRKPSPHFLFEAARNYDLELSKSWMIGDRDTDIECGQAAGVQTIRIETDQSSVRSGQAYPMYRAAALLDATAVILGHLHRAVL